MLAPSLLHLHGLLGEWRGSGNFVGNRVELELRFTAACGGRAVDVAIRALPVTAPLSVVEGYALLGLQPDGRLGCAMAHPAFGALVMAETPDDPGVVALEGRLPDNSLLILTFSPQNDALQISSSIRQGYVGSPRSTRILGSLQRLRAGRMP